MSSVRAAVVTTAVSSILLVAGGCASTGESTVPPPEEGAPPQISVRYLPDLGDIVVESDRPVHVAVFSVTEGGAPVLLYPARDRRVARAAPGDPLRVTDRYTQGLPRQRVGSGDSSPACRVGSALDPAGDLPDCDFGPGHRPTWVYVLASTEPLRTDEIVDRGSVSMDRVFWQRAIEPKLEVLVERLLTTREEAAWTNAYTVIWP